MSWPRGERLYQRLPEIHRRRDREQGEPLRALLATLESQLELLEDDVAGLYENWFLETCEEWVVPYLADLLGVRGLGKTPHAGAHPRAQVARTLEYRRRKGTPVALERATRDVTGWYARVVEMFELLAHTQNVAHPRPGKGGLFDLRRAAGPGREDDPFAPPSRFRTVDVRRIASGRGRFNIPDLALHVWRLRAFPIADSPASPAAGIAGGYLFDPLGRDVRLFNRPQTPEEIVRRAGEHHLPVPLRRGSVAARLADYYGAGRAFEVRLGGQAVAAADIDIADLTQWSALPPAPAGRVQADPETGRIRPGAGLAGPVRVSYLYGFAAGLGGGPYDRRETLADPAAGFFREVSKRDGTLSLAQALSAWASQGSPQGVIRVLDSEVYDGALLDIAVAAGRRLVIEAADGERPVLRPGRLRVTGAGAGRALTLNGFLVDASIEVAGSLELLVTHCTLVPSPGRPSLAHGGGDASAMDVRLTFSITGALHLPDDIASLRIEDGILDAASAGDGAMPLPALVSGALADPPSLGTRMELSVQLGPAAARTVTLSGVPTHVAGAAALLQQAIRAAAAGSSAGYGSAVVTAVGDRLLVRSGSPGETVAVAPSAADQQTAGDLGLLVPPARAVTGLLSGELAPFPAFSPLQVRVTLGGDGPHLVTLAGSPQTLDEAAVQLQAAIRAARQQILFTQATVARLDDRLLVRPGIAGESVAFAGSAADPQTVTELALAAPPATRAEGVFSGRLVPFPGFPGLEVAVTMGATGPSVARLFGGAPADLADLATALQEALHNATPAPFPAAQVLPLGDRLLVRAVADSAGGTGITFAATAADAATVAALALAEPPAERLDDGRLSTSLVPFPAFPRPRLQVEIDGDRRGVELRRLAGDLGTAREALEAAVRAAAGLSGTPGFSPAFATAEVLLLGDRLLVRSGAAAVTVLADAADPGTATALALDSPLAGEPRGLLSGEIETFPAFQLPALGVSFGGRTAETVTLTGFPRNAGEARALLVEALHAASTPAFTNALVAAAGDRLLVASGVAGEGVRVETVSADPLTATDLALVAPPAVDVNGLLSGELYPFPVLFQPTLRATIGATGPRTVRLAGVPTDAATAGPLLQDALRAAHTSQRFANATVEVLDGRLLVRPGIAGEAVTFEAAAEDANSAENLGLLQPPARPVHGLMSGDLAGFAGLPQPRLRVTRTLPAGSPDTRLVSLAGFPADLDQARSQLEAALAAELSGATVTRVGNRLLLQPGAAGAVLSAAGATTAPDGPTPDATTFTELGLAQPPAEMLLLSGDLSAFPVLPRPRLAVTLGSSGAQTAELLRHPADLATARTSLENAIRAAAPSSASFTGARVEILDDRLLVLPGTAADAVTIGAASGDTTSVGELRLNVASAATAVTGLYSGTLATFPTLTAATPALDATLGTATRTITLTPKPATLAEAAIRLQAALQAATPAAATFTGARVLVVGSRLLVLPGVAGDAVSFAATAGAGGDTTTVTQLALGTGATATQGLLSGALDPFPALTVRPPAVSATLANVGPRIATLETVPTTLAEAAAGLQAALRATTPSHTAFSAATVQGVGNRLEIRAGTAGSVAITVVTGGAATATDLKLTAAAGGLAGLYSGDLAGFAGLSASRLQVSLGGTSAAARLASVPADLATAATALQAAIRAAAPGATFTGAIVEVLDTRLLVTPGVAGDAVAFANTAGATHADLLKLSVAAGASDMRGLLGGPVAAVILPPLAVVATLGGTSRTIDLGTIPTGVGDLATVLQAELRGGPSPPAAFAGAQVLVTDDRILVLPGTVGDRVAFTAAPASPEVVSQLRLDAGSAIPIRGLLSGSLAPFPVLRMAPAVQVTLGTSGPLRAVLGTPRSLEEVALLLEAGLRQDAADPGASRPASFTGARVRLLGGRLLVTSGNPAETVEITEAASGPATASALGLITTGPGPGAPADGWLAGPPFPVLHAAAPQVAATFGATTATVPLAQPADVVDARSRLQTALQAAGFAGARVELYDERRLLVLSSTGTQAVSFAATAADTGTASQLALASPTAVRVTGLLSGSLASFPVVSAGGAVEITLGTDGPHALPLPVPGNLAAARALLEAAIRQARPGPSFVRARVLVSGDRLLVLPGVAGEAVVIDDVLGRPATATQLRLVTAQGAVAAQGWLGGDPAAFRGLAANTPRLTATLGGVTRTASLTDIPDSLTAAAPLLQSALRAADSSAAFAGATVEVLADRLRVRSGTGGAVTFADAATGSPAATLLGLSPGERGLLSGPLTGFAGLADDRPAVGVTLGGRGPFRVTLAASPSGLADAATLLQAALRAADGTATFTGATVAVVGERLHVTPGNPRDAVAFSPAAGREADLVSLGLDPGSLVPAGGLLSGPIGGLALRGLPRLQMRVQNGATVTAHPLTLTGYPADLESAAALLEAALRPGFPLAEVEILDGRRLLVSPGVAGTVSFEAAAAAGSTAGDAVSVVQLRLDAAQAVTADGLLSGRLSPFPRFASSPAVLVQIGAEGPFRAALPSIPATLEAARQGLEEAIRGAHASPAFYLARVVLTSDRQLVVLPGRPGQVVITPTAEDTRTVDDLMLRGGASRQVGALLSALLPPQVDLTAASPRVHVSLRSVSGGEDFDATPVVPAGPVGVAALAAALEFAIAAAMPTGPAPPAWVIQVGGSASEPDAVSRLVVVPGTDGYSAGLSAAATDATTVAELGFEVGRALGGGATDDEAGPPLSLARVTVLGRVVVRELREASAVLFSQPVRVQRRHVGCVRYSYLPDGSETPRRYRCQPDLALALAVRQALDRRAREIGATSAQQLPAAERADIEARERQRVLARLEPRFASTRFGDPGYAHLTVTTAPEILTGADDGSEMGAFHHLQEPARRRQLAILLEEYLRFGLDAGIFHVTESTE